MKRLIENQLNKRTEQVSNDNNEPDDFFPVEVANAMYWLEKIIQNLIPKQNITLNPML